MSRKWSGVSFLWNNWIVIITLYFFSSLLNCLTINFKICFVRHISSSNCLQFNLNFICFSSMAKLYGSLPIFPFLCFNFLKTDTWWPPDHFIWHPTFAIVRLGELTSKPFQRGNLLYLNLLSESDICRRQILTYKDAPRTEKNKIFIVAVDP